MTTNVKDQDPVVIHLSDEAKQMQAQEEANPMSDNNATNTADQTEPNMEVNDLSGVADDDGFGAFAPTENANSADSSEVELGDDALQPVDNEYENLQERINQLEEYGRRQTADFQNYRKQVQRETAQSVEQAEDRVFSNGSKSWITSNARSITSKKKTHRGFRGCKLFLSTCSTPWNDTILRLSKPKDWYLTLIGMKPSQ